MSEANERRTVKVMVVDDYESFRQLMRLWLSRLDSVGEVREADHGDEAIAICEHFEPDVLFIDSLLPRMSGDLVARRIKEQNPQALVVSVSGFEKEADWADERLLKSSSTLGDEVAGVVDRAARGLSD